MRCSNCSSLQEQNTELDMRLATFEAMDPVAWRFRTKGIEHGQWRVTDDASLIGMMRGMGHWDIQALVLRDG
jgi:hypothetical protein